MRLQWKNKFVWLLEGIVTVQFVLQQRDNIVSLDDIRYGAMNHHNETVHKLRNTFGTSSSMTYFSDIFCVLLSECVAKMLFNYISKKKYSIVL